MEGNDFDEDTTDGMWNEQQLQEIRRRAEELPKELNPTRPTDGFWEEWREFEREMNEGNERIRRMTHAS